jgi:hypothetical protein
MTEYICNETEILLLANWTTRLGLGADIRRRTNQLRVSITNLVTPKPTDSDLIHQHPSGKTMIDDASPLGRAPQAPHREVRRRHGRTIPSPVDRSQRRTDAIASHTTTLG